MKRIIKWQSQHLELDTTSGKLIDPSEPIDEPEDNYYDDPENYVMQTISTENVINTPFGLWRVNDCMNPYRQFQLWMAHTNFTISDEIVKTIKDIPGIEILKILTRYRFLVGVGELFDIRQVRTMIETALNCHCDEIDLILDNEIKQKVNTLKNKLSKQNNRWAIYVFPNGTIDFTTSNESNFYQQLNLYKQAVDYSNGVLIESDND